MKPVIGAGVAEHDHGARPSGRSLCARRRGRAEHVAAAEAAAGERAGVAVDDHDADHHVLARRPSRRGPG
jgi:hypothetical protein